jgi:hypothetical protein
MILPGACYRSIVPGTRELRLFLFPPIPGKTLPAITLPRNGEPGKQANLQFVPQDAGAARSPSGRLIF